MSYVWAVKFWPVYKSKPSGALARTELEQWADLPKFLEESLPKELREAQPTFEVLQALARSKIAHKYMSGKTVDAGFIANALVIYDEDEFALTEDIFLARGRLCFKGRVPDILRQFDLGSANLIKIPSFASDFKTLREPSEGEGDIYTINFGSVKDSILLDKCKGIKKYDRVKPGMGPTHRPIGAPEDAEFVFSKQALSGPDLWVEESLSRMKFVSGPLGDALFEIGALTDFNGYTPAMRCEVVGA